MARNDKLADKTMSKNTLNIADIEYQACPAGGPETAAHQLINTFESMEMKYLAVATSRSPEIVEYPDSEKVGVLAQFPAEGDGKPTVMRYIIRDQAGMAEYWEGE